MLQNEYHWCKSYLCYKSSNFALFFLLKSRDHLEFICRMKDYISRSNFIDRTIIAVGTHFLLRSPEPEAIQYTFDSKFKPSSGLLKRQELAEATFKSPKANTISQSLWFQNLVNRYCWFPSSLLMGFYSISQIPRYSLLWLHNDKINMPYMSMRECVRRYLDYVMVE